MYTLHHNPMVGSSMDASLNVVDEKCRHINMTQSSVQLAWGMLTDAFILPESILTKPEVLAAAALCLAFAVHNQPTSYKDSSVNTELFQRVCSVFALDSKEVMSTVCWMSQGLCNASSCNWFNA